MKILQYFLVSLGIIFLAIIIALTYVWVYDWSGVRSVTITIYTMYQEGEVNMGFIETVSSNAQLIEDLSNGEATLTDSQINCLREKLGSGRVDEIYITGIQPTTQEIMIGATCL